MSNGFEQRMQLAEELEANFITIFNRQCSSHPDAGPTTPARTHRARLTHLPNRGP